MPPAPSPSGPVKPPKLADEFFARVAATELLAPAEIDAVRAAGPFRDAAAVAAAFKDRGQLTPFQARKLLAGYAHGFWLDRYRVLDELGTGATSLVYLADHPTYGRVAVKVLAANPPKSAVERFHREAQVAAGLDHPHVVRAYEGVCDGKVTYMVLEHVPGETLDKRVTRDGRIPWGEACGLIAQAAAGLDHAHRQGIVHRDVKPANLIVSPDGRLKVLDLGLVLIRGGGSDLTAQHTGAILGTPDFVAPEQARDGHKVDARADVYALGCTLYHLLAGASPFPSRSLAEKLIAHQTKPPRPIHELVPDVPGALVGVLDKMMAKWPEDRLQSAAEACEALLLFADNPDKVEGRPPATKAQPAKAGWRLWGRGEK